ncbi:MAG: AmmeMemoRadiSam system protein A [Candidatus ainarchaeum sp.]|nr:AmmeMemoRadiSam system protein A [Candidatus ainarchaeum sp.]
MNEKIEYNNKEKEFLLKTARKAIEYYMKNGEIMEVEAKEIPSEKLLQDGACFVSIHEKESNELRGCMGMLEASRPLINDVIQNAVAAANEDPRFYPLRFDELNKIKISISILTKPEKLEIMDYKELLDKLEPKRHGLIIKKGWNRATFLPVVWEQLPEKEEFLGNLCLKAGLNEDEWMKEGMEFFIYEAIEFEEK